MSASDSRSALGDSVQRAKGENHPPDADPVFPELPSAADGRVLAYVREVVAGAPPLTPEQQSGLRGLFRASLHDRAGR
jgi:hypothetical protein